MIKLRAFEAFRSLFSDDKCCCGGRVGGRGVGDASFVGLTGVGGRGFDVRLGERIMFITLALADILLLLFLLSMSDIFSLLTV